MHINSFRAVVDRMFEIQLYTPDDYSEEERRIPQTWSSLPLLLETTRSELMSVGLKEDDELVKRIDELKQALCAVEEEAKSLDSFPKGYKDLFGAMPEDQMNDEQKADKDKTENLTRKMYDLITHHLGRWIQNSVSYNFGERSDMCLKLSFPSPASKDFQVALDALLWLNTSDRIIEVNGSVDTSGYLTQVFYLLRYPSWVGRHLYETSSHYSLAARYFLHIELRGAARSPQAIEDNHCLNELLVESVQSHRALLEQVESERRELSERFGEEYAEFSESFMTLTEQIAEWHTEKQDRLRALENTYNKKLALSEPAKLWADRALSQRNSTGWWAVASVVTALVLIGCTALLFPRIYNHQVLDAIPAVPKSFLIVAVITFLLFMLRLFVKVALSSRHLQLEYEQKGALTTFYLSLLEGDHEISETDRAMILSSLFMTVDTGLVKTNESSENGNLITALLQRGT